MARTQKNKATSGHLGLLKAKLAKLRRELIEPKGGGGGSGEGFDVAKTGDARIGFVGEVFFIFFNNFSCQKKKIKAKAVQFSICSFMLLECLFYCT